MLRNCVCLVIAHMLDATPVMGWVGWGGDDDIPELAHMLDSTQLCLCCHCTHAGCYVSVFENSLIEIIVIRRGKNFAAATKPPDVTTIVCRNMFGRFCSQ